MTIIERIFRFMDRVEYAGVYHVCSEEETRQALAGMPQVLEGKTLFRPGERRHNASFVYGVGWVPDVNDPSTWPQPKKRRIPC